MNLRFEILKAVAASPGAPINEIADAISYDRQKTAWSVRDCAQDGLLAKRLDDVTRQPGYALTDAGKKRLAEGPAKLQGGNLKKGAKAKTSFNAGPRDRADAKAKVEAVSEPAAAAAIPAPENYSLLGVLADIRAAVGDPEGRLMQDELVDRVRAIAKAGAIANADLVKIRGTLLPLVFVRLDDGAPGAVACAERAADLLQRTRESNREMLNMIAIASETLAPLASGDIDTSDMDLHELAKHVADALTTMRDARDSASQEFASVHAENERLRSQLQTIDETCDRVEKLIHYGTEGDTAFRVQEMMDFAVQYNNTQEAAKEELRSRLANQTALVEKLEHLLQSARNEAEHLRRHVTHNEDGLDGQPLGNLLMGAREFLEVGQRVTVTGGEAKVEVRALNITFDLAPHEVSEVLEHATALERKLPVPF